MERGSSEMVFTIVGAGQYHNLRDTFANFRFLIATELQLDGSSFSPLHQRELSYDDSGRRRFSVLWRSVPVPCAHHAVKVKVVAGRNARRRFHANYRCLLWPD